MGANRPHGVEASFGFTFSLEKSVWWSERNRESRESLLVVCKEARMGWAVAKPFAGTRRAVPTLLYGALHVKSPRSPNELRFADMPWTLRWVTQKSLLELRLFSDFSSLADNASPYKNYTSSGVSRYCLLDGILLLS